MRKYIFFPLMCLAIIVVSFYIAFWQGLHSFVFAWVLNLLLMSLFLYVDEIFHLQLTSSYFSTKAWEKQGKIYHLFGIHIFRKLLVITGWEKLNKPVNPVNKALKSLEHLELGTRKSEFFHLMIFIIVLGFTIFVAIRHGFVQSLWLLVLNLILNFYPVILQRYNRPRLQKLISAKNNTL